MKKVLCLMLTAVLLLLPLVTVHAESEPEDGAVLYENDFSNGLPDDFRFPEGHKDKVKVEDGILYIDAVGREFTRVFLPESLDKYGNYEITIHATLTNQRDNGRWGSIIYRAQNVNYPYYHMCFRYDSNAGNGVEFAERNESDAWNVTAKGSVAGHTFSPDKLDEVKVRVIGDHAVHSINGTAGVDCNDASVYGTGGIGLQANFSILKVDDIKVTYIRGKTVQAPVYTEIAQPALGVIGGYTLSEYYGVRDADKLLSEATPANVIMRVNDSLEVLGADGKKITTAEEALEKLGGKIMPTFRISDELTADALCSFLSEHDVTDVFVMSEDESLVKKVRDKYPLSRGVLDFTKELGKKTELSDSELLQIRARTNKAFASIAVIPDTVATPANVKYLYDRLIAVWVGAVKPVETATQAFSIAAAGGHGAVTDNTALMYDVIENRMSGNKLFRTPLNIGHRGIPQQAPENTVEGSLLAYELGADCIENDIYITKDGELMVMHDGTTGRTANGNLNMESSTSDKINALLVNKQFPNKEGFKECHVPYLSDYFKALKGKDVQIFVEIKSTNKALIDKFKALVEEYGVEDQVSVITFHDSQIKNLKQAFPEMSAGFLCNPLVSGATGAEQAKAVLNRVQRLSSTYNPSYSGHTAEYAVNANMRGLTTWPWTVDDKNAYVQLFMEGFNGLTTNNCKIAAKFAKTLTAENYAYELNAGETLAVSAGITLYNREKADVSKDVRVIPLDGKTEVLDGNVLKFDGEGEHTFALEYTYDINSKNSYTLYTQPVTVNVKSPVTETGTETETEAASTAEQTEAATAEQASETTGAEKTDSFLRSPALPVIICGAVIVIAAVVILIVINALKKKNAK